MHPCAAPGCGETADPGHFMCPGCWRGVPGDLQREVVRTWQDYQGAPSDARWMAYRDVFNAAVAATS